MTTTQATTTRFYVLRDSATADREEDQAMAHVHIATTDTLEQAQKALVDYIEGEAAWLCTGRYRTANSLRRAADILDGIQAVSGMTPKANSRTSIRTANLVCTIAQDRKEA